MTTVDTFDTPPQAIGRDRWGRPLVVPPGGGKPTAYTRCTTYVSALDDTHNLTLWKQRMVALGLADRPDLLLAVAAHRDDKSMLNKVTGQALEAAQATAAATTGTALHSFTDRADRGQLVGSIPQPYAADIDAYRAATAGLRMVAIEQFCVLDELKIGGTPDRIVEYLGRYYVADVKTGSLDWGGLKIAMQCGVYAHSTPYDVASGQRRPTEYPVDLERAIIIHLPAGTGRCELFWVDIATGWEAVQVATRVREYRARKHWFSAFSALEAIPQPTPVGLDLAAAIATAGTVEELRLLWTNAVQAGTWTNDHLTAAQHRKAELQKGLR